MISEYTYSAIASKTSLILHFSFSYLVRIIKKNNMCCNIKISEIGREMLVFRRGGESVVLWAFYWFTLVLVENIDVLAKFFPAGGGWESAGWGKRQLIKCAYCYWEIFITLWRSQLCPAGFVNSCRAGEGLARLAFRRAPNTEMEMYSLGVHMWCTEKQACWAWT